MPTPSYSRHHWALHSWQQHLSLSTWRRRSTVYGKIPRTVVQGGAETRMCGWITSTVLVGHKDRSPRSMMLTARPSQPLLQHHKFSLLTQVKKYISYFHGIIEYRNEENEFRHTDIPYSSEKQHRTLNVSSNILFDNSRCITQCAPRRHVINFMTQNISRDFRKYGGNYQTQAGFLFTPPYWGKVNHRLAYYNHFHSREIDGITIHHAWTHYACDGSIW